jgi:hypothetical protein
MDTDRTTYLRNLRNIPHAPGDLVLVILPWGIVPALSSKVSKAGIVIAATRLAGQGLGDGWEISFKQGRKGANGCENVAASHLSLPVEEVLAHLPAFTPYEAGNRDSLRDAVETLKRQVAKHLTLDAREAWGVRAGDIES